MANVVAESEPFGEALRRSLDGRTMSWLSRESDIRLGRLYRLASGRTEATVSDITAIAAALKIEPAVLLPGGEQ